MHVMLLVRYGVPGSTHLSRARARHNAIDLCRQALPFCQDPIVTVDLPERDTQNEHVVKRVVTWHRFKRQNGVRGES